MRILMLSPAYPIPPDNGSKRRVLAIACHLSQNHKLTLVSLQEPIPMAEHATEKYTGTWQDYIIKQPVKSKIGTAGRAFFSKHSYSQIKYWNKGLREIILRMLATEEFDCLWIHFLFMVIHIEPFFFKGPGGQKQSPPLFILDEHNVDELVFKSFWNSGEKDVLKLYAALEMWKARHFQKKWFPRFDAILGVSPEDLQETARYVQGKTNLWLAPNGVDIDYFRPCGRQDFLNPSSIIVFGGSLDVKMNQDAVYWFSEQIFPLIKQRIPGTEFWIVGRNPAPGVWKLAERQGIKVTGTVADVRDYYRKAGVFAVPLRMGGGTKLKTLEAMAMGLPIVSTAVGAQGLDIQPGQHMYLADRPDDFAARIVELMEDHGKAAMMGAAARLLVEKKYSWAGIMSEIDEKLKNLFLDRELQRKTT